MMVRENHHHCLITTWHGVSNPDIEEAPEKGGLANRGFWRLGPCAEATPSTPLSYSNVTATLWGTVGNR